MTDESKALYLLPYLVSLAFATSILAYTWSKRPAKGATVFAWYMLGHVLWMTGFIFELIFPTRDSKIFWDGFQWAASLIPVIAMPIFTVEYVEQKLKYARALLRLSFVGPTLFFICLLLEPRLHWIYQDVQFQETGALHYSFSALIYAYTAYAYLAYFWGFYILVRRIIYPQGLYQKQAPMIALGFFIHFLGLFLTLLDIPLSLRSNVIIPLTFTIGNAIIAWGLFRFRIFEVTPIARDKVFEAMVEPVVIVDNNNLIVDINTSMLDLLGMQPNEVIGKPAKEIFQDFPIPIKQHLQTSYARAETSFVIGGKDIHYEMTVWPMHDAHKNMTGRIFISHDITALKELEQELRKLNAELENRVHARTHELAEAYDTTLEGWARALELRDEETEGHTRRVTDITLKIAMKMGIMGDDLEQLRRGAILHDIGKMGIPDKILLKPGKLTREERAIMEMHPETAHRLLSPISFLSKALEIPHDHHEKWNGTGYPRRLKGEEIPLAARIFAVADVWDAIRSSRPYKKAWSQKEAIAYFIEQSGIHFDPRVVSVFLEMLNKGEI